MDTQIVFTPENEGSKRIIRMKTILRITLHFAREITKLKAWDVQRIMASKRKRYSHISNKVIPKIKVMGSAFNQDRNKRRRHTFKNLNYKSNNKYLLKWIFWHRQLPKDFRTFGSKLQKERTRGPEKLTFFTIIRSIVTVTVIINKIHRKPINDLNLVWNIN